MLPITVRSRHSLQSEEFPVFRP